MKIMLEMTECSYTLECSKYSMDFIEDLDSRSLNSLYNTYEAYMIFSIPTTKEHYMKLSFSKKAYDKAYNEILLDNLSNYFLYIVVIIFIATLFARFALRPLHEALNLNDEFVKDMLHDFNTPLSSLKINFKILQKKFGEDDAINRSEEAMQTINSLQSNLSYFLSHSQLVQEKLELSACLIQRVKSYEVIFSDIQFFMEIEHVYLKTNSDAFVRIVDNLLSNAAKYNVVNGTVHISFVKNHLIIEDSGIGIQNPSKVFNRFYKETSRGMGIGLHVVKKLCDDLNIEIKVESQLKKGTKFSLNLEKLMFK
jgi:signal transduction histidine kinase